MKLGWALRAMDRPSPWRIGNDALYDLCRARPRHKKEADVLAKIWLIGRSYAAAIERRNNGTQDNDRYYVTRVVPAIIKSPMDTWLADARQAGRASIKSAAVALEVHRKTTALFGRISGLNKRSLASKYLHFHVPELFFIYDSRAVAALGALRGTVGRASRRESGDDDSEVDGEYRKLYEKSLKLSDHIQAKYNRRWPSPRQIDDLLLWVHAHR